MHRYLIDLSAWARSSRPTVTSLWQGLVNDDRLLCHPVFAIECLHSAIGPVDYSDRRRELEEAFDWIYPDDRTARVAVRMQQRMATTAACGQRVKTSDLMTAALAAQLGLGVLHHDRDYDLISEYAGESFESRWIAERGSLESARAAGASKRKAYRKAFGERMVQLRDDEDLAVWPELIGWLDERLAERGLEVPVPPDV